MNQKGFVPILIILLIAAAVGGYFIYQNQNQQAPIIQQTPQPSPTPVDDTANWKTYTNTKVGFQIKYPSRYPNPGLPSGGPGSPIIYADEDSDNIDILFGEKSTDSFGLFIFPFSGNTDDLINSQQAKGFPPYNWSNSDYVTTTTKAVTIDGVQARWLSVYMKNTKDTSDGIFFITKNHGFILHSSFTHSQNEINQILSTFKFTN